MKREEIIFMYIILILTIVFCFIVFNKEKNYSYRYEIKTLHNDTLAIVLDKYDGTTTLIKPTKSSIEYEAIDIEHNVIAEDINRNDVFDYLANKEKYIFIKKLKSKYPVYSDVDDLQLIQKIIAKLKEKGLDDNQIDEIFKMDLDEFEKKLDKQI